MDTTTIIELIQGVGFPIGVAIWLLIRTDKLQRENTEALHGLKNAIKELCIKTNK